MQNLEERFVEKVYCRACGGFPLIVVRSTFAKHKLQLACIKCNRLYKVSSYMSINKGTHSLGLAKLE